ncbi:MAG: arsenic resistance N-acetyltransferase ArsN2 [Burkholderiales bacterium]
MSTSSFSRQLAGELIGTALLLATVIGSGIMGERLAGGNVAIALPANTLATGAILYVLITCFGRISGAHFNPVVTLTAALLGQFPWRSTGPYIAVQIVGALLGVLAAHWMFSLPAFFPSEQVRAGPAQWWSEIVATFGLVLVILSCARYKPEAVAASVGAYIVAAYWFTASTSFANPAVTIARATSNTFAGIRPFDVPGFVLAQFAGAIIAAHFGKWLLREPEKFSELTFRRALPEDWDAVKILLAQCGLPIAGAQEHFGDFLVAHDGTGIVGCAGLERYGPTALLRSVGVLKRRRGERLGYELVVRLVAAARAADVATLVLLTDTAQRYFRRFGFRTVPRKTLPDEIMASAEFHGACPASAMAMLMNL